MPSLKAVLNVKSIYSLNHIPGPRWLKYIKLMFNFQRDSLEALENTYKDYPKLASYPWPVNTVIIYDLEMIKNVLMDKEKIYVKGSQTEEMNVVMGQGLVTNSDRKSWLENRVVVSRELSPKSIKVFSNIISSLTQKMISEWQESEFSKDISIDMRNITFNIAGKTLLGSDLTNEDARLVDEAVLYTSRMAHDHMFQLFPLPYWIPTKKNRLFHMHNNNLKMIVNKLIKNEKEGKNSQNEKKSILQRMVPYLDEKTLYDEVITLLIAGYETTSNTLSWTLGLLAQHPNIQEKVYQELESKNLEIDSISFRDELPNLYFAILESIRLYTAIPMSSRKNTRTTQIGDFLLPKNTSVVIPVWVIHRDKKYWDSPNTFSPDRFKDINLNTADYYLPFSKGERRCVGENFSIVEVSIIVSEIIKKYKITLPTKELPRPISHVSLKPENGMNLHFERRDNA